MAKIGKWRVKRKVAETPPDSGDHTGDNTGSTRPSLTPSSAPQPEHNLSKIRKYSTQTTMSLLALCGTRSSPRLRKPIRKVKGTATMTPPRTCLIETTHNLNLAAPPEPQIRMCGADFSMSSNQGESSKSKELPLTSADLEQIDQVVTNALDALQGSNPFIPPPTAAHEVAPMFSMPLNMDSAVVGNQTDVEGSCKNGNEQSNMRLARSSSLGCTEIADMYNAYATDEVNSSVDPSLVTLQEGYRVKEQVAPLLRKIFSKFGDIAKDSSQQSIPIRSMYLENVCSIYQDLEMKKNLTQITSLEIQKHLVVVADCEAVNVQVGWLRKRLQDISEAEEELSRIKDKKAVKARKTVEEEMCVKKLEESKKKTRLLEIVAEESRKKDQLLESEVASIRAEKRE